MPSDGGVVLNFAPSPPLAAGEYYSASGETNGLVVGDYATPSDTDGAHVYGTYFPVSGITHASFLFLGWYRLSEYYDLPTPVGSEWLHVLSSDVIWGLATAEGVPYAGSRYLVGRWAETVTLDAQGGSVSTPTLQYGPFHTWFDGSGAVPADTVYGTLPIPSKAGHEFLGWWTGATSEYPSVPVTDSTVLAFGHHTLYAHWNRLAGADVTVTFSLMGGASSDAGPRTYTPGELYGSLPSATKVGESFAGWYTAPTGGSRVYTDWPVPSESHTLYARWTTATLFGVVYFLPEGGVLPGQTRFEAVDECVYGVLTGGPLPVPTRLGYAFVGWWTQPASGGIKVEFDHPVPAGNTELYARWEAVGTTVVDDLFHSVNGWVSINVVNAGGALPAALLDVYRSWLTPEVRAHRLGLILEGVMFDYRTAVDADNHPVGRLDAASVPVSLLRNVLVTVWYSLGVEMSLGAAVLQEYRTGWLDSNVVLRTLFLELRTGRNRFQSGLAWSPTYVPGAGSATAGVAAPSSADAGYPEPIEPEPPPISYNPPPG